MTEVIFLYKLYINTPSISFEVKKKVCKQLHTKREGRRRRNVGKRWVCIVV